MKKKPSFSPCRDFESPTHLSDSPHSPLRFHSPLRSDLGDPADTPPYASPAASPHNPPPMKPASASAAVDDPARLSPLPSPSPHAQKPLPPPTEKESAGETGSAEESDVSPPPPAVVLSRAMRNQRSASATGLGGGGGGARAAPMMRMRGPRAWERLAGPGLCLRVSEVVLCMISFSVMAADKTKGWSGDSYDRYKEYRYCLSVNVIAFVYAGFQASDLAFHLSTGRHVIHDQIHYHFDFFMDQILAYLLISASSSAATRVDDWKSNWGSDKFTDMAGASVAFSFLAFMAFAISSLTSGLNLFSHYF